MNRRFAILASMAAGLMVTFAAAGFAAKFNKVLDIGTKAPTWSDLEGTDGKSHSLAGHKDAKAVVLVFTCNHCPVAKAYEDRLIEFTAAFKPKDVAVVAINCNNIEADKLDKMKERAEERGFNFEYLYDPGQEVGRAYGATVTPHWFVLDQDRRIAYMGAFDDNMIPGKVKSHYIQDAVEAVLAGNAPEVAESKPLGCGIQYE